MSEMKNISDEISGRLDTVKENINKLKTQQQKLFKMDYDRKYGFLKKEQSIIEL